MPTPWSPQTATAKAVVAAGFLYDPSQDIIYSHVNALQRQGGYTWAYDVSAPGGNMILDCEPIYFTARGTMWMIELWKGQYGIETGGEIGLYNHPIALVPTGSERGRLYTCANNADMGLLKLSFRLNRHGQPLFHRGPESHWWLTGFKWGVFTGKTSNLTMDVSIEFLRHSEDMQREFLIALAKKGYHPASSGTTVRFQFNDPKTHQPGSRSHLQGPIQKQNRRLVEAYLALKEELGVESNDPNEFKIPHLKPPVRPASGPVMKTPLARPVREVVKSVRTVVKPARSVVKKAVAHAADLAGHGPVEPLAAHDVFAFFHNKVWHNTHQPAGTR